MGGWNGGGSLSALGDLWCVAPFLPLRCGGGHGHGFVGGGMAMTPVPESWDVPHRVCISRLIRVCQVCNPPPPQQQWSPPPPLLRAP